MAIVVPVAVRNAAFRSGLDQMRGQAQKFAGDIKGMFAGAFAATAVIAWGNAMIEKLSRVSDLADRFGESAESLQRVGNSAELAGADIELVAKAVTRVTLAAAQAARGNEKQAEMFDRLGISAGAFAALPLEEKIIALSAAWQRSGDSSDKQITLMEILGTRMQDIMPLLVQGPEALRAGFDGARVVSGRLVEEIDRIGDNLQELKQLGVSFFGWLVGAAITVGTSIGAVMERVRLLVVSSFDSMRDGIGATAGALGKLAKGDLAGARKAMADFFDRDEQRSVKLEVALAATDRNAQGLIDEIWGAGKTGKKRQEDISDTADAEELAKEQMNDAARKKRLSEEIAEIEEKQRLASLDGEALINALYEKREALVARLNDETVDGLEAKKELLALDKQIADARDKKIKAAQKAMDDKAAEEAKLAEAAEAEKEREERKREREATDAAAPEKKDFLAVKVSSLASVGGGGGVGGAVDPQLRKLDETNSILERIARAVETSQPIRPATLRN